MANYCEYEKKVYNTLTVTMTCYLFTFAQWVTKLQIIQFEPFPPLKFLGLLEQKLLTVGR